MFMENDSKKGLNNINTNKQTKRAQKKGITNYHH